ncbi:MAG TPA: radical SAM protein [bacterium]|nr:radical SAM protein [bacterium]
MADIPVNANIHRVGGRDILAKDEPRFREYRRQWRENPEQGIVAPAPLFLDIEVTSACNLRCPFCATTYRGGKIKAGMMPAALAYQVIDEAAAAGVYGCKFNYRGEPLLHPVLPSFVARAKRRGMIDVYFNTNAMLLTEEKALALIEAGLDRISVSFEGITKEFYERNRVGADYDTVLRNVDGLQQAKRRLGVTYPALRVQTVRLPGVDLDAYAKFWEGRVDEIAYLDYKEMKERRCGIAADWACPQLWQRLCIWWDGTVVPCNHDDDAHLQLGNANHDRIVACWQQPRLQEVRALHRQGMAHTVAGCDGCYLRDSEIGKLGAKG